MSQVTATTTTPLLTVHSTASSVTTAVMMAHSGPTHTSSFCSPGCGYTTTTDASGHMGVICLTTLPQKLPQSQMPFQAYAIYAMVIHRLVSLSELSLPPVCLYMLVFLMVSAFYFQVPFWMSFSLMGLNHWHLHCCSPSEHTCGRHSCILVMVQVPH